MERIRENFKRQYNAHREVSIHEAMIGFSGRLGFKQYVPLKPTKRGIKVWVRADPYNGFMMIFRFILERKEIFPRPTLSWT